MSEVYVVVPEGIDDPTRPSGGNIYDRRVIDGLVAAGWSVHVCPVPGAWPLAGRAARLALGAVVAVIPDGAVVVVDGLVASAVPDELVPAARRLRLVVLLHLPRGHERERSVLSAAAAVVVTSDWTRRWLADHGGVEPARIHVAPPGVDPADLSVGTADGRELLCVGAVTPNKGHDLLLSALASLAELPWRCVVVGSTDRDRAFVHGLRAQARATGIDDRVHFAGPLIGEGLDGAYAAADVLVVPSRFETYGMVVTEAVARGLPVIATEVGGMPEALGGRADGELPGLLVRPGDASALAAALRTWLDDEAVRRQLRLAALARRDSLTGWSETSATVARVLTEVAR